MKKPPGKMGRPTENPRETCMSLRLTAEEAELLRYCASRLNVSKTRVIVNAVELLKRALDGE